MAHYENNERNEQETIFFVVDEADSQKENEHDTGNIVWSRETTLLLIQEFLSRKEQFRDPKVKKRSLWTQIKKQFGEWGYTISEDALDRKWRNLKKTYTTIKDNKRRTGRGATSWEYFDYFEEIYFNDVTMNTPHTISSSRITQCTSSPTSTSSCRASSYIIDQSPSASSSRQNCVTNGTLSSLIGEKQLPNFSSVPKQNPLTIAQNALSFEMESGSPRPTQPRRILGENMNSQFNGNERPSTSSVSAQHETQPAASKAKKEKALRNRALYNFRKRQLDLEEQRVEEIKLLRRAVERSNDLQEEKNQLIRDLLLRGNNTQ